MTASPARESASGELRLDRLLGRPVFDRAGHRVGRLEEFRAEQSDGALAVTEYVLGAAGLIERLGVAVKLLLGRRIGGYVARWDQLDVADQTRPRLTCAVGDLRRL
jgi:hypothetical protein